MNESNPVREEIQRRRAVIAELVAAARVRFNQSAVANELALKQLQADCPHPAAAVRSDYHQSHFKRRCSDCGKLLN